VSITLPRQALQSPEGSAAGSVSPRHAPHGGFGAGVWPGSGFARLMLVVVFAVALAARLIPVLRGGGLFGDHGYDDGVYYAAATAFVHGQLPYRAFLLLHPPGIVLALAPFAVLGRLTTDPTGLAAARLAFMCLGAFNAVLVSGILIRRFGVVAAVTGGAVYAVGFPGLHGERSALLEPLSNLGLLAALWLLHRWPRGRMPPWTTYAAGAALGAGAAVKIWGVVPLLIVALWQWAVSSRSAARQVLGGGVLATTGLCLSFFALAPVEMVRMVVIDQLRRPADGPSAGGRLRLVFGPYVVRGDGSMAYSAQPVWPVVAVAVLVVAIAASQRRARIFAALTVTSTTMVLLTPSFYLQYTAIVLAPGALVAGAAASTAIHGLTATVVLRGRRSAITGRRIVASWLIAVLAATVGYGLPGLIMTEGDALPFDQLRPVAARLPGCVLSDSPVAMVELDVLSRNFSRGCAVSVDVTGSTYDASARVGAGGEPVPRAENDAWQRQLLGYLRSGSAVMVLRGDDGDGLSMQSRAVIDSWRVLTGNGRSRLFAPPPAAVQRSAR